jgi:two-component system sensor histidine kinase DesK
MTTTDATATPADHDGRRELNRWWYLATLFALVFPPLFDPGPAITNWLIAGGLIVVGGTLFIVGEHVSADRRVVVILAFAVLGTVGVWVNGGAAVFFVFAASYAGELTPRSRARRWLVGLTGVLLALTLLSSIPIPYRIVAFGPALAFVWIVGHQVMDALDRDREARHLRIDNARVERLATLGERERIARDLHDLLGHTLTGIVVRAELIQRVAASDPGRAASAAADVETIARDALSEVRSAVTGWRHHALDAEIDVACDVLTAAGVELRTETSADVSMSPAVEAAVALAVREAVTNVVRHAGASTCRIAVTTVDDQVRLVVADDGRGSTAPDGSGLTGMRERLTALGGRVERRMDDGTTLTVTVPAQEMA